jgi:hypothetical protein
LDNPAPQPINRVVTTPATALTLTPEESAIISLLRSNSYQEINIQVQDSVITSVDQTIKFRRKKGGGLIFGAKKVTSTGLNPHEIELIKLMREKPYQQVTIMVMDSEIKGFNQTVKFKKKD